MEITEQKQLYSIANFGPVDSWADFHFAHPKLGSVFGKQFLRQDLGLSGMELSLNSLPQGKAAPFVHGHRKNEELYLFLGGKGQFMLNDEVVEVRPGTAIRVAPPVLRCWRNTGNEPLTYVVIQAQEGSLSQATLNDGYVSDKPANWPDKNTAP